MKKILINFCLTLIILISTNHSTKADLGQGQIQLSDDSAYWFIEYIRGETGKMPAVFYVTTDGSLAYYWYCPYGNCQIGSKTQEITLCETATNKKCELFAKRRTITWKNGINPGRGKESTIKSKWSDEDILAKLTELGFYKNDFSSNETDSQKNKKTKKTSTDNNEIALSDKDIKKLKDLKQLLDDGILTEEEFKKAKNKILKK